LVLTQAAAKALEGPSREPLRRDQAAARHREAGPHARLRGNKFAFEIDIRASKTEVKQAVEALFK